jgi:ribosomal-protein-alanine N-acetyltransferase
MIDYSRLPFRVEPMMPQDVDQVMEIEAVSFSAPWSARAYNYEIQYNEMAHYYVVRPQSQPVASPPPQRAPLWQRLFNHNHMASPNHVSPSLVGYGGFWLMVDEAHISTIATHPDWRRRGIGELLMVAMIEAAVEAGAERITLEVRVSNVGAQRLYRKYGFEVTGVRKKYYSDNGEDALIMTTPNITTAEYQAKFGKLKNALLSRLSRSM